MTFFSLQSLSPYFQWRYEYLFSNFSFSNFHRYTSVKNNISGSLVLKILGLVPFTLIKRTTCTGNTKQVFFLANLTYQRTSRVTLKIFKRMFCVNLFALSIVNIFKFILNFLIRFLHCKLCRIGGSTTYIFSLTLLTLRSHITLVPWGGGEISPPSDISFRSGQRGLNHKSKKVGGQKICNLGP